MGTQNCINNNGDGGPDFGLGVLTGVKFIKAYANGVGAGDTDLYTVPAGKKAFIGYSFQSASVSSQFEIKVSSTYYLIGQGSLANPGYIGMVLNSGESISLNVPSGTSNAFVNGVEFDATCALKSARLLSFSSGDNTLYTCPTGKKALILSTGLGIAIPTNQNTNGVFYYNNSGFVVNIHANLVPNGSSPGTSNQITSSTAASSPSSNAVIIYGNLNAGDIINLNVDNSASGQIGWVNILEY